MSTHVLEDEETLPAMPSDAEEIMQLDREYVMGTYGRQPVVFVRGEGARLWDSEGREYLDFLSGIAVVGVGHCHPKVAGAIAEQAHRLMHISNLFDNSARRQLRGPAVPAGRYGEGVLLQLRHGGERGGAEDRPEVGQAEARRGLLRDHHLHGLVPRTNDGGGLGDRAAEISRFFAPAGSRIGNT